MVFAKVFAAGNAPKEVQLDSTTGYTVKAALAKAGINAETMTIKVNGAVADDDTELGTSRDDSDMEYGVVIIVSRQYKGNQANVMICCAGSQPTNLVCDHNQTLKQFLGACPVTLQTQIGFGDNCKGHQFKFNRKDVDMDTVLDQYFAEGDAPNTLIITKMYKGNE